MHNIEKHPTRKGVYIGYAAGAWHVRKGERDWFATPRNGHCLGEFMPFTRNTLRDVSAELERLNGIYAGQLRAKALPNPFNAEA